MIVGPSVSARFITAVAPALLTRWSMRPPPLHGGGDHLGGRSVAADVDRQDVDAAVQRGGLLQRFLAGPPPSTCAPAAKSDGRGPADAGSGSGRDARGRESGRKSLRTSHGPHIVGAFFEAFFDAFFYARTLNMVCSHTIVKR
ncbi:hypothetical protein [Streptomyces sp. KL116D]|uniref:hypothetical protein n=1 Tax=Streptomyces sp. KL116D TaxID=3045152 RepID=UPI0035578E5D